MIKHKAFAATRVIALMLGATFITGGKTVADQVIGDDLIVQGSACVGLDCVNNESFGFDTIRLKENNTRIKFDDTSVSAGFPANDWQLTANDSASGGLNKFSIENTTVATVPFTVLGPAPTNSLFVDGSGRVGLRTSTPGLDLSIKTGNTPAHRLEQDTSNGFPAQTWDIGANEANFFVRDITSGSRLPFRIRPGAPTSSIDVNASGNVGVGTASPQGKLHLQTSSQHRIRMGRQQRNARKQDRPAGVRWRQCRCGRRLGLSKSHGCGGFCLKSVHHHSKYRKRRDRNHNACRTAPYHRSRSVRRRYKLRLGHSKQRQR
jgi:hypothetical protein